MKVRFGEWSGWHVAVLMFAGWLLCVPLAQAIQRSMPPGSVGRDLVGRMLPYLVIGIAILVVGPLREIVRRQVMLRFPKGAGAEIFLATGIDVIGGFAWMGCYVLWWHVLEGPVALEQRLELGTHDQAMTRALSADGMLMGLLLAVLLGPIIEELIFRGVLFRLWERRHGWTVSMLLTSTVFGLYHANFVPAFIGSLIYTALYSRTGSLKVVMLAHATHNLLVYYPILGRFIFPHDLSAPGDPRSWALHVMALSISIVVVPLYLWIAGLHARDHHLDESHVALSR